MGKNYGQMRKQKELARRARQQEKQQRRTARPDAAARGLTDPAAPSEPGAAEVVPPTLERDA
jgi:hypothetical protein